MTELRVNAILFDMDGVLISSIASANRCWQRWAREYGVPGWESFEIKHGTRAVDIMKGLRPDLSAEEVKVGLRLIEDFEIADTEDLKVLPGVRALLESLPVERWAIVTSATLRLLLGRLEAAKLPVPERIIAGDHVVNGKPHPEPYLRGAALLGFRPEECLVVEDAPSGVGAGVAAGCPVLGVLGTHAKAELHEATEVVRTLEDVRVRRVDDGLAVELRMLA